MASNDWTCEPRQHDFAEMFRANRSNVEGVEVVDPPRLFCRRCGWVREVPRVGDSTKPNPDRE